jgi:hypothetical protein
MGGMVEQGTGIKPAKIRGVPFKGKVLREPVDRAFMR